MIVKVAVGHLGNGKWWLNIHRDPLQKGMERLGNGHYALDRPQTSTAQKQVYAIRNRILVSIGAWIYGEFEIRDEINDRRPVTGSLDPSGGLLISDAGPVQFMRQGSSSGENN
jgi:hypothetical protein